MSGERRDTGCNCGTCIALRGCTVPPPPPKPQHTSRDQHNLGCVRNRPHYDALGNLAMLAIDVALEAPLDRASQPGYYCYINRDTVRAIRAILDDAGIPWKQQKKELKP